MRILKYILLLLVLIFIGVSVFVATQKGEYEIVRTRVFNSSKPILYNYVNDLGNWPDWISSGETTAENGHATIGPGASLKWDGADSEGSVKTLYIKQGDSIVQHLEWNGEPADAFWKFEETGSKTTVTLTVRGKMGFMPKIYAAFKGGAQKIMETEFENSLARLEKTFDKEINKYTITADGPVTQPGTFYLHQTILSTLENLPRNTNIMMGKLLYFFRKNKIQMAGKPFVIYHSYDKAKALSNFSVCIPVREEIYTSPGSDISSGSLAPYRAAKVTLHGDYSHLRQAWDRASKLVSESNLTPSGPVGIEIYKTSREDNRHPSSWVTEILIPVKDQAAAPVVQVTRPVSVPVESAPDRAEPAEEIPIP